MAAISDKSQISISAAFIMGLFMLLFYSAALASDPDMKAGDPDKKMVIMKMETKEGTKEIVGYSRKMRPNVGKVVVGPPQPIEEKPFEKKVVIMDGSTVKPIPGAMPEEITPISQIGPMTPIDEAGGGEAGHPRLLKVTTSTAHSSKADDVQQKDLKDRVSAKVRILPVKERPLKVLSVMEGPIREIEPSRRPITQKVEAAGQIKTSPKPGRLETEQSNQTNENKKSQIFAGSILQHLADKYRFEPRIEDVRINMTQTPYGPSGTLILKNIPVTNVVETGDTQDRARIIAAAFVQTEAALFAITDMGELREKWLDISKSGPDSGYIYIYHTVVT